MTMTETKHPEAVFIPDAARAPDGSVYPEDCTLLWVDGDNNDATLSTADGKPFAKREWGEFSEVEGGTIEWLPDLWVIKVDDTEYWEDPLLAEHVDRIYGVYLFNRKNYHYICSITPNYECLFLGSQCDYKSTSPLVASEWDEATERLAEQIDEMLRDGDAGCEDYSYFEVSRVEGWLENKIKPGCWLPERGKSGGFPLSEVLDPENVTHDEAMEEAREYYHRNEF